MRADLDHLPAAKRRELERVTRILFEEFEDAIKTKLSEKRRAGRILKLILFGSYARGDWVEDRANGYLSDYDLLIVVNTDDFTDLQTWWANADEHLVRALTVTRQLATPVNFIVHSLRDVNSQLGRGRPFFTDIARDGITLYEPRTIPLSRPASSPLRRSWRKVAGTATNGSPMPPIACSSPATRSRTASPIIPPSISTRPPNMPIERCCSS